MSLMRVISRSVFAWQMLSSSFCGGGSLWNRSSPRSSSEPLIDVSGVRTSCETTATNSDLSRSSSLVRSKRMAFVMAIVAWLASIFSMSWSSVLKPPPSWFKQVIVPITLSFDWSGTIRAFFARSTAIISSAPTASPSSSRSADWVLWTTWPW